MRRLKVMAGPANHTQGSDKPLQGYFDHLKDPRGRGLLEDQTIEKTEEFDILFDA